MKRLIPVLILLAVCAAAFASQYQEGNIILPNGTKWDGTIGAATGASSTLPVYVREVPTGYEVYTVPAVGSVTITIPAGTTYLNSIATVPYQMSLNTTTLKAGTAPTIGGVTSVSSSTIVQYHGYLGATSTVSVYAYGPGY